MSIDLTHLYVVILCGGGGTRLWPLSRSKTPKQFIELVGEETLFTKTLSRAKNLVGLDHIYIMTNQEYVTTIKSLAPELALDHIVAEPMKKNTAMAMGVISAIIHKQDQDAVVINLASDHLITDLTVFNNTLIAAATIASSKRSIVSIGILPTFPHPGLGYIHRGSELDMTSDFSAYSVAGFREKPSVEVATEYLASGEYYWNANLYTWSTELILSEFASLAPELAAHIQKIAAAYGQPNFAATMADEYALAHEEAIDTAISEKTDKLVVVPGNFGWSDVGSWNVVHDEVDRDKDNNALIAREHGATWLRLDTHNSLVSSGNKLVATIGVEGLMIIDTKDALLITTKDRAQDVKHIIEQLKESGNEALL